MTGIRSMWGIRALALATSLTLVVALALGIGCYTPAFADDHGGSSGGGGKDDGSNKGGGSNSGPGSGGGGSSNGGSSSGPGSGGGGSSSSGGSGGGNSDSSNSSSQNSGQGRIDVEDRGLFENFGAEIKVRVEIRDDRVRFRAEVENLNVAAGTMLNVCFQGTSLGTAAVDGLHGAELELDSRNGATIPALIAGSVLEVKAGACGSMIPAILSTTIGASPAAAAPGVRQVRFEDRVRAAFQGFGAELNVQVEREPDRNRLRVEVEDVNLPAGSVLNVCLGANMIGQIALDSFHSGELRLDSRRNDLVPAVNAGDVIAVTTGACSMTDSAAIALKVGNGPVLAPGAPRIALLEGRAHAFFAGFQAELDVRFEAVGNRMRFRAEVENLNLPAGTSLNVCRQGQTLGTIMVNQLHAGQLELNSSDSTAVPSIFSGDVIDVRQGSCASTTMPIATVTVR